MTWTSHLSKFKARDRAAREKALIAAAQVAINAVKTGLRGGYTSGDFVTGRAMNSVTREAPRMINGEMEIRIGTALDYPLFWELGHHNLFTRKYERKEVWVPAVIETSEAQAAAFARVYAREMRKM
jgi:hypothetical protein